jgi:hypothetical protein
MMQRKIKCDPALIERVVFAFALLEALSQTGLDFIFKGGTCLMLLLAEPKRLSTDIDILVRHNINIDEYIKKAALTFPFTSVEEQIRKNNTDISKRHFKFFYESPLKKGRFHIILDVVYEVDYYLNVNTKKISNELIITKPPYDFVKVPTINGILGDKVTAFAPYSIGIPYGKMKELEIIKQFFDVATLFDVIDDFNEVVITYKHIAMIEINNRQLIDFDINKTLMDSYNAAIAIIGRGKIYKEDFLRLLDGIQRIRDHIIGKYTPTIAESQACKVAYLIANIIAGKKQLIKITDEQLYTDKLITNNQYSKLNHMKKSSLIDFAYLYESILLIEKI